MKKREGKKRRRDEGMKEREGRRMGREEKTKKEGKWIDRSIDR